MLMNRSILGIYCAGAFGREVRDIAWRANQRHQRWHEIVFIDDFAPPGTLISGTSAWPLETAIESFGKDQLEAVVAIGEPIHRESLYKKLKTAGIRLAQVIDPTAIVVPSAQLGEGIILTHFCSVAADARIGNNVAINVQSIIGHDVRIGDNTVLSSMVNLGGACTIGEGCYIGMNSQIKDQLRIGNRVIIGMASAVHQNIDDDLIALGNPARPMRRNDERRVFKHN